MSPRKKSPSLYLFFLVVLLAIQVFLGFVGGRLNSGLLVFVNVCWCFAPLGLLSDFFEKDRAETRAILVAAVAAILQFASVSAFNASGKASGSAEKLLTWDTLRDQKVEDAHKTPNAEVFYFVDGLVDAKLSLDKQVRYGRYGRYWYRIAPLTFPSQRASNPIVAWVGCFEENYFQLCGQQWEQASRVGIRMEAMRPYHNEDHPDAFAKLIQEAEARYQVRSLPGAPVLWWGTTPEEENGTLLRTIDSELQRGLLLIFVAFLLFSIPLFVRWFKG